MKMNKLLIVLLLVVMMVVSTDLSAFAAQTAGRDALGEFAPKFAELNDDVLFGEIWSRELELSPRDRSMITVTALISGGNFAQLPFHLNFAKQNGVTQTEISEVITHLSFYVGWPKAWSAFNLAREVFSVDDAQMPLSNSEIDTSRPRQTAGRDALGEFAPKFAELNDDVLFGEIWSRELELSPRDRSMITVTALISDGNFAQLPFHLNFAKQNGVTQTEISEAVTHLAFYVGWPKAWSAFNLARDIFPVEGE